MSGTPTLEDVIRMGVDEGLFKVNTAMPAVVETFDGATNTVSVQPSIMRKYEHLDEASPMPIITDVPIAYPRGGNFTMKFALKKGDSVLLIFSQRSLDIWKEKGGVVDPQDPRRFHLSDAIAIPGGWPTAMPIEGDVSDRTILKSGSAKLELFDSGKFKISGANEFLDVVSKSLEQLITGFDTLSKDKTNTLMGPQPLLQATVYAQVKAQLESLKGMLDAIKG